MGKDKKEYTNKNAEEESRATVPTLARRGMDTLGFEEGGRPDGGLWEICTRRIQRKIDLNEPIIVCARRQRLNQDSSPPPESTSGDPGNPDPPFAFVVAAPFSAEKFGAPSLPRCGGAVLLLVRSRGAVGGKSDPVIILRGGNDQPGRRSVQDAARIATAVGIATGWTWGEAGRDATRARGQAAECSHAFQRPRDDTGKQDAVHDACTHWGADSRDATRDGMMDGRTDIECGVLGPPEEERARETRRTARKVDDPSGVGFNFSGRGRE
ncbi:hypothetical protein B0H16DRAFT_1695422 [Mycena metata]|uniref:Uncharacterized protein n=1 Tax=Mycena metata TaxID=1033252 RepID=A0AAD7I8L1_9AGAR|nr:hypothetical protein B0H16DRAFT_1695422 [Mycena metata]